MDTLENLSPSDLHNAALIEASRRNLLDFVTYTFPQYQVNWHHAYTCLRLQAWARGETKRLMIEEPPRHGKSELVSRRLPAWIFGIDPSAQIIASSYSADLTRSMNRSVQRIIDSDEYARVFPSTSLYGKNVRSTTEHSWLRNTDEFEVVGGTGYYKSAGVGGGITGRGFTHGIIDDPFKSRKEADSATIRNAVWDWYTSDFYTRQESGACILLTMTRWHEDDLAGRLRNAMHEGGDEWEIITLPAICERPNDVDTRSAGEPLWPEKYDLEDLAKIRAAVGTRDWMSLYQQKPSPQGSGMFNREWFEVVDSPPTNIVKTVRYWDMAATKPKAGRDPDYTVGVLMGKMTDDRYILLDIRRIRDNPGQVEALVRQTAIEDGVKTHVHIEQEPGSSGVMVIDHYIRRVLAGFVCKGNRVTGDKSSRAHPF